MNVPAQEHPLIAGLRSMITRALTARPEEGEPSAEAIEVAVGRRSALAVKGVVINDDEAAEAVTGHGVNIAKAEKALKRAKTRVLEIPKAAVAAVNDTARPIELELSAAKEEAGRALTSFRNRKAAEARREQERRQAELDRIAREAATKAEPEAEEAPPLEADPEPEPAKMTRTVAGSHVVTARLACEIHNVYDVEPTWLKLVNTTEPLAAFERAVRLEEVARPKQVGEAVYWKGLKFYLKEGPGAFRTEAPNVADLPARRDA